MPQRRVQRDQIERVLAQLRASETRIRADARFSALLVDGSAVLRLTRVVAHTHVWTASAATDADVGQALALALRDAWAAYEGRLEPARVEDTAVAHAVDAALQETAPPEDREHAASLAISVVGGGAIACGERRLISVTLAG